MKKQIWLLVLIAGWVGVACAQVEYVDPSMGGQGVLLEPTKPTVSLPNSMVRVYPVRNDQLDDQIHSFPLTIISHRLGELFWLMPGDGSADDWDRPKGYDQETETPYYYSARFESSLIRTEFTPTAHSGYFRFTFPSGKAIVYLANRQGGEMSGNADGSISGIEDIASQSDITPGVMHAYVYGEFSAPVDIQTSTCDAGKQLTVTAKGSQNVLEFRYGISFISADQAKKNLQEEIPAWNFDKIKRNARDRWNDALGQIDVEGGTPEQKRVFYTSLYRCYERMVDITEDGQYYSAFDHKVHQDSRPFYVDNWLWDTYRALEPLQTILNPEMEADKVQSYVRMYEQSGWMPEFAVLWGNHECMTGNPFAAWAADVWNKGVTNFDLATAYAGIRKNSLEGTWLPWRRGPKCSLDDFLNEHGYMPALHPGETETISQVHPRERRQAISVTLAQSYEDWCAAQIARELGNDGDYQLFLKRAADYKNVFRQGEGHMWPKDASGNWIEPFDPGWSGGQGGRDYTTENNDYTYDWDVQHDLQGLFDLMGGCAKAEAEMDELYRRGIGRSKYEYFAKFPDSTGMVGQFSMGNEPSLHIPYVYDYLGAPWKTQSRVRMLLDTWFRDTTLGMPGDEDGGGMSSFVVFSMMGFYPVTPGVPVYNICSPVFNRITIHLHNGKNFSIVCRNNSSSNKYVQSIQLDGKSLDQVWFRHADLTSGSTLELQMGDTPNTKLGADPATFPPSAMNVDPREFEGPNSSQH
ncbi:MAG TPA: GH92 family glycosyl hydrolase [Candidatus Acidoferrales bacterium]|jgi:predicted alpha-1,2-mannosidase|nr:GH92 family glycosyl hydrolase [Candidatus Acidoferrales bacterium]